VDGVEAQERRRLRRALRRANVPLGARRARVLAVLSGNTLELGGVGPVRLIGVHSPPPGYRKTDPNPSHHIGDVVVAAIKSWAPIGSSVWYVLGSKPRELKPAGTGRWLVYIWLRSHQFLNRLLLESGYAQRETDQGESARYSNLLDAAESAARDAGRGFWAFCPRYPANNATPGA
jgi:endonuclease YncB( thermonuclease family)